MPHPTPLSESPKAIVFLTSKYSFMISTAGIKVLPSPNPTRREKVTNRNSKHGAQKLKAKPTVASNAPDVMTIRLPSLLHTILPTKPI